jgi:hypothetical protein
MGGPFSTNGEQRNAYRLRKARGKEITRKTKM